MGARSGKVLNTKSAWGKVSSKCPLKKTSNQGAWARNAVMRKSRASQEGRSL